MVEYRVKPGGMHQRFLSCRKKIQVIGGGFGNGKTAAACVKGITLARDYPGSNGIIAMSTYSQLNDTIRAEFYKWIPNSSVKRWPTIADNTMILNNKSKINFRYLQQKGKGNPDGTTTSNLLSATYDWAVVDQIENPLITYKDFLDLLGRLRGTTEYRGHDETMPDSGPRWLILTANPAFNWFFHKIIKPYHIWKKSGTIHPDLIIDEFGEPILEIFEASTHENKHNLPADFIAAMESAYTGQFRKRFVDGEWGAFEGLVQPDFDQEVHCISQHAMMEYIIQNSLVGIKFEAMQGFDFGIAVPSCYLIGFKDMLGRIFIIDGFHKKELSLSEIGHRICSLQAQYGGYLDIRDPIMGDPSIWNRTVVEGHGEGATSIKNILSDPPFNLDFKPGQNDILSGIAKIASYLAVRKFPHFMDSTKPGAAIYFADHLSFIPDEFGSYFWKIGSGLDRVDTPIDKNNDAMDTLKYLVSYMPPATELLFSYSMLQQQGNIKRFLQ